MTEFTHIKEGRAEMVDISEKTPLLRTATATGRIFLKPETLAAIKGGNVTKGNVLATARVAATLAVKATPSLIPMCHQIPITNITVEFTEEKESISVSVTVRSVGKTGVEMEALTGVSVALLTIWDMVKSIEKDPTGNYPVTKLRDIRVLHKSKNER